MFRRFWGGLGKVLREVFGSFGGFGTNEKPSNNNKVEYHFFERGFWEVFGRFWGGFREVWVRFWGRLLEVLGGFRNQRETRQNVQNKSKIKCFRYFLFLLEVSGSFGGVSERKK